MPYPHSKQQTQCCSHHAHNNTYKNAQPGYKQCFVARKINGGICAAGSADLPAITPAGRLVHVKKSTASKFTKKMSLNKTTALQWQPQRNCMLTNRHTWNLP